MGQIQRMLADAYPLFDVCEQTWFREASKGCYNVERVGNNILFHFDTKDFNSLSNSDNFKSLERRNISCGIGVDWMAYIMVSYNFKDSIPRRKNSRKCVILD